MMELREHMLRWDTLKMSADNAVDRGSSGGPDGGTTLTVAQPLRRSQVANRALDAAAAAQIEALVRPIVERVLEERAAMVLGRVAEGLARLERLDRLHEKVAAEGSALKERPAPHLVGALIGLPRLPAVSRDLGT